MESWKVGNRKYFMRNYQTKLKHYYARANFLIDWNLTEMLAISSVGRTEASPVSHLSDDIEIDALVHQTNEMCLQIVTFKSQMELLS